MFRNHTPSRATQGLRLRLAAAGLAALTAVLVSGPSASAAPSWSSSSFVVPLTSAEGIAAGAGYTFYQGELFTGDIYRGNIRSGTISRLIDAPDGRLAVGMKADIAHNLLFVAGGPAGQAYVYNTKTGGEVATVQLAGGASFINDVALTTEGAWFTNSTEAALYFLPVGTSGELGAVERLPLTGPAADASFDFNLNGIAASPDNRTLIVAHTGLGALYTVDPGTGASAPIAIDGATEGALASPDGILVRGHTVWVVQNTANGSVARLAANADFSAATLEAVNASSEFQSPATAALFGNTLAVVNAQFFSGAGTPFEVVRIPAR